MSYKPEFEVSGQWYDNAERYHTRAEAERSARARFASWTMPTAWRVTECEDEPTYVMTDEGRARSIGGAS